MQKVHWKVLGATARLLTLTGLGAWRRRRRRPLMTMELNEPKEPWDLWENAEANEPPLEWEVPKLLVEEIPASERADPSSDCP